jgi:hypothetical protein
MPSLRSRAMPTCWRRGSQLESHATWSTWRFALSLTTAKLGRSVLSVELNALRAGNYTLTPFSFLGAGVTTAVSAVGEGVTFGADTPVTIAFGSITGFFTTTSTITGGTGADLNSFAGGNLTALQNFGWGQIANLAAKAAASRIPTLEPWSDTIGDLAERASDLTHSAQEVCR